MTKGTLIVNGRDYSNGGGGSGTGGTDFVPITKAEYDALGDATLNDNIPYLITDWTEGGGSGGDVLPDLAGTREEFDAIKDELPDGSAFDTIDEVNKSGEVYDDVERVIGTWFGKPIYRRIIKTDSVFTFNSNSWKSFDNFPISGIVIKASIISIDANYVYVPCVGGTDTNGNLRLQHTRSNNMTVRENTYIIAEYTKVGD